MSEWIATSDPRRPEPGDKVLVIMSGRIHVWLAMVNANSKLKVEGEKYEHSLGAFDYWLPIPPLPASKEVTNG